VYGFCFAVGTGALIATKTRGSLAGALIGVAVISVLRIPRRERLPVAVVGLLGLGVTLMLAINPLIEYVTRGESVESLETLSNRTTLWTIAFDFFGQKPVFGWGITASRGLFFEQVNLGGAHNALVNVLVDGGLVGTGLWVGLIVAILAGIHRLGPQEPDSKLLYGLVATMLVNSMTTEGLGSGSGVSAMWLFLVGAWVGVLQREHAEARRLAQLRASRMSQSTEIELVPIPTRRPTLV
jgi:O-antigen ligase